ncbi:alpha/beta-hydrolase [Trametes maxima]|nr:alpha/beta-hydrolase [Trametes maxima]
MKRVSRFIGRLRGKREGNLQAVAPVQVVTATAIETIHPLAHDLVGNDIQRWADKLGVASGPVDGVWWYPEGDGLIQAQQSGHWVGLHFHGGGYVLGSVKDEFSGFTRNPGFTPHVRITYCVCKTALEYTLSPRQADDTKRSFPVQILEALSAYHYLLNVLRISPERIILIGDSAGGHLALALQRHLLESGKMPTPRGLILLSPWCDLSVERDRLKGFLGSLPVEELWTPYFSPALHPPPSCWPPTLVYSGKDEIFATSISALVSQLRDAGANITTYEAVDILPRYKHDFLIHNAVERTWPDEVGKCWARIKVWIGTLASLEDT